MFQRIRWLLEVMTGGRRCHGTNPRTRMGADGGCGTEEKPCPVSRVVPFSRSPESVPFIFDEITSLPLVIDFYTQARKALSEHSPFDSEDAQLTNNATTTSPHELARLVSKQFDSRKRQKRSHSHKHSGETTAKKASGTTFWDEAEEFFRPLSMDDIDKLYDLSSFGCSASDKCLRIPFLGNASATNNMGNGDIKNLDNCDSGKGFVLDNCIVKEEVKEETEQLIQFDNAGPHALKEETTSSNLHWDGHTSSPPQFTTGIEWLLGAKNKTFLPSERFSKKRKLLGGDAGLEKLLVVCPVQGSSSLCHYCSLPDTGDQLNHLILCSSCAMAVHVRCYGVQDGADGSWLCSWCKQNSELVVPEYPCKLCPKQGGALKPVGSSGYLNDEGTFLEFAHLFCCQWMPEVYIGDIRKMEPILNVEGIKETQRKLLCYICKRKHGTCVRCSNGACRTSFHPICTREALHRMEIWGKFGCDDVELRAFCSKHSEVQHINSAPQASGLPVAVDSDLKINKLVTSVNKPHSLNIDQRSRDKIAVEGAYTEIDKLSDDASIEDGWSDARSNSKVQSECGDVSEPIDEGNTRTNSADYLNLTNSLNGTVILKKLIDRGKVNAKDVASDIGITPDFLASMLAENFFEMALHCKEVNWLGSHAYLGTSQNYLKVKIKPRIQNKTERGVIDDSDVIMRSDSDVPVKSVPPRRRTKSNIQILKDDKVICSSKDISSDDGTVINEISCDELVEGVSNCLNKDPVSVTVQKILDEPAINPCQSEGDLVKYDGGIVESTVISSIQSTLMNPELGKPCNSAAINDFHHFIKVQDLCSSYIHPLIHNKLIQIQNGVPLKSSTCEFDGVKSSEKSQLEASSSSGVCFNHQSEHTTSNNLFPKIDGVNVEKMVKARNMGQFELSLADEVEGELIYHQHRLLCNVVRRKHLSDDLIFKIMKHLPVESDAVAKRKWDTVLVNQYLYELREAKKQGRRERRQKEAQAILAAAAAASSRNQSVRKNTLEESPHQENMLKIDTSSRRAGFYFQQMLKNSDYTRPALDSSKEHRRTCDICRRLETLLNPVLICSGCKVAVHLDCYRSVKETAGPWYCELCEDLLSRSSGAFAVNSWEKPNFIAECGLCGGTSGAFRRATDGQWVHAFCAEWILKSTFRRGQVNLIQGMEMINKGIDVCHICSRRQGVCIKCNYGHCQSTFHPSCARSAEFHMNVRTAGTKLQYKAYCENHSLEQRAKADTRIHGVEEFKCLKQVRVELERLRLLCERIIKREKLKRELVLCSHGILASNRDFVALARRPLFPSDVSSESVTTSLKGYTDDYKSGSEAMQRSDDLTVDSTVAGKRRIKVSMSMNNDQKTDDSFTSQHHFIPKDTERLSFSRKQIPHRSSVASWNFIDDGEKCIKYRKHTETFEKELLMTSDQASIKNQRLPKGFVYVPVRCLPKEKESVRDPGS